MGVNPVSESQPEQIALTEVLAGFLGKPALIAMLLIVFATGVWVAGAALHDPDSCWLLATGRYIVRKHCLPSTDPFSYTFALQPGLPFVLYQWLSEIVLYLACGVGKLQAVLVLVSMLVSGAFVILPLKLLKHGRVPMFAAFGLVICSLLASSFRFLVRPEIFSFLFASAWLYNLAKRRMRLESYLNFDQPIERSPVSIGGNRENRSVSEQSAAHGQVLLADSGIESGASTEAEMLNRQANYSGLESAQEKSSAAEIIDWRFLGRSAFLIVPWCNFHTGFISGLFVLLFYVLGSVLAAVVVRRRRVFDLTACLTLLASIMATFINPYGIKLWLYIPQLFFAPFNEMITELHPVMWSDRTFLPFIVLFLLALVKLFKSAVRGRKSRDAKGFLAATITSAVVIAAVSYEAFHHLRLIPWSVLALLAEFAIMFHRTASRKTIANEALVATGSSSSSLGWIYNPNQIKWTFAILALAVLGTLTCSLRIITPELPQSSAVFTPPIKAIEYLSKHDSAGRIFNDAQFGDVLIWHSPSNPKVFIDTRYDMYGTKIVHDYDVLRGLKPGWQEVIDAYRVKLIIFPTKMDIIKKLSKNPDWCTIYADDAATVLQLKSSLVSGDAGESDSEADTEMKIKSEPHARNSIVK